MRASLSARAGLSLLAVLSLVFLALPVPPAQSAEATAATPDSTDRPIELASYCRYFRASPYCAPELSRDDGGPRLYVVYFDPRSEEIRPGEEAVLRNASAAAQLAPAASLAVTGHAERRGSEEEALDLSVRRAAAVADWLVTRGVDSERISLSGAGFSHPLLPARADGGEALNRRAEILLDTY